MEEGQQNKSFWRWPELILTAAMLSCLAFWLFALQYDVYEWALVGAVFEMLWLPMIVLPFLLPAAVLFFWWRRGFLLKSAFPVLLLASAAMLTFLLTRQL